MKKYIFIVIALVGLVVLASGCTSTPGNNTTSTKTYNANGISFNYPSSWFIIADNTTENGTVIALGDVSFNQTNGTQGNGVTIIKIAQTANSTSDLANLKTQLSSLNGTNSTVTIAGVTANETTFNLSSNNTTAQLKFIDFQSNNFQYLIQYVTVSSDFQKQAGLFDTITKSLKVQ
jgi:hypothetical protein